MAKLYRRSFDLIRGETFGFVEPNQMINR